MEIYIKNNGFNRPSIHCSYCFDDKSCLKAFMNHHPIRFTANGEA